MFDLAFHCIINYFIKISSPNYLNKVNCNCYSDIIKKTQLLFSKYLSQYNNKIMIDPEIYFNWICDRYNIHNKINKYLFI